MYYYYCKERSHFSTVNRPSVGIVPFSPGLNVIAVTLHPWFELYWKASRFCRDCQVLVRFQGTSRHSSADGSVHVSRASLVCDWLALVRIHVAASQSRRSVARQDEATEDLRTVC